MVFAWAIVTDAVPAGDHPQPAVGEPQAGPRRAARLHPAGGLGGGLAHRLAAPAGYGRVIRGGLVAVCAVALLLPAAITTFGLKLSERRPGRDQAHRARPGVQDHVRGRDRRGGTACARRCRAARRSSSSTAPGGAAVHPGRPRDVRLPGGAHHAGAGQTCSRWCAASGQAGRRPVLLASSRRGARAVRRRDKGDHEPADDQGFEHRHGPLRCAPVPPDDHRVDVGASAVSVAVGGYGRRVRRDH